MSNYTTVVTKLAELLRTNEEIAAMETALSELRVKRSTLSQETAEAVQRSPGTAAGVTYRVRANYGDWLVGYRINHVAETLLLILVSDHPQLSNL